MRGCHHSKFLGLGIALILSACQRPDGVPAEARGDFTLLNGQRWNWRDRTLLGSVMWSADENGLSLWVNADPDTSSFDPHRNKGPTVSYRPLRIESLQHFGRPGRPCELTLTSAQASRVSGILAEALRNTSDPLRQRLLAEAAEQIRQLDESKLVTDASGFGCVIAGKG